jgi:LPXTG-site transpeptidase (sortase) family protein
MSKIFLRYIDIFIIYMAFMFVILLVVFATNVSAPNVSVPLPVSNKTSIPASAKVVGIPVTLTIPAINLSAQIEQIGLTPDGALSTPLGEANAGWYRLGQRPGEIGSAVVDGHFGQRADGSGSVFDELEKLKVGDEVYTTDTDGNITGFIIRETRSYEPSIVAPEVFNSSDGLAHLNLITCQGIWDKAEKTFSHRLVVFTDKQKPL